LAVLSEEDFGPNEYVIDEYTGSPIKPAYSNITDRLESLEYRQKIVDTLPLLAGVFGGGGQIIEAVSLLATKSIGVDLVSLLNAGQIQVLRMAVQLCDWRSGIAPLLLIHSEDYTALPIEYQSYFIERIVGSAANRQAILICSEEKVRGWVGGLSGRCSIVEIVPKTSL
jgi:hypothetical protein